MSKPYIHAKSSARRFGGEPEDYLDIHAEMDCSKSALADVRHRVVYHSAFGIYVIEKIFGQTRTNSAGKVYSVRDVAEQHVMEDLGFIPSLEHWMKGTPIEPWMQGKRRSADAPEPAPPTVPAPVLVDGDKATPIPLPFLVEWPSNPFNTITVD